MKLMFCPRCGDVLAMRAEQRACACGLARGGYLDDESTVVQSQGSISLALHNGDFRFAVEKFRESPRIWRPAFCLRAYLNPLSEVDVRYTTWSSNDETR
jgi:hypothetical protein